MIANQDFGQPLPLRTPLVNSTPEPAIVYFDGVCGLCNRTVDFLLRRDRQRRFLFSPLQGERAASEPGLHADDARNPNTLVLKTERGCYRRSAAVVRILWRLGGIWAVWGALLWLIPLPLRDLGYRAVSASRYRLFGKKESCRVPTPEERDRFLP